MTEKDSYATPEAQEEGGVPSTAADSPAEVAADLTLTDEELVALCRARVCPACNEKEQADEHRLRTLAEMDNFKKRLAREQTDFRKFAAENVLADLLPILDTLGLAIEHGRMNPACKDVVMGVEMTEKLFLDTLRNHGLTQVGAVGDPFDPAVHEAVGSEAHQDMPDGVIVSLMHKGYRLGDRLLRPAKVMVNKLA
ncbi:MAG: nucleotide exchange factor GrpE [Desulfovibrionaceae bacterium]